MKRAGTAAALALAALAAPAQAGFPVESEETCPVGGEKFTYTTTGSYTIFGQRPDGKPYGSWMFPLAIPECPSNALVVYREFKPEEIPALTALVASPEYQALRSETQYFRASWLAARMEPSDPQRAVFLLLQATWEVDWAPETKTRYQRAFAEAAEKIAPDAGDLDTLFLRFRLANARRELGEFDAARAALDSLPLAALDVTVPTDETVPYEQRRDAESRRFLHSQIAMMRKAITAGDTSSEPVDLMDPDFLAGRCADLIEEDPSAPLPDHCNDPAIRKAAEEFVRRRRSADFGDEMPKDADSAAAAAEDAGED
ncbi:MAG: hypothetical protein C0486_01195 [Erythrobacter sp.]|nr:hypothetical protein [Erythrobacter sp.]MBA4081458.1 hypothetical protein [Erythrobacter sp.]